MHDDTVVDEFTGQAETFNLSAAANDAAVLEALLRLAAPRAGQRWLEAACGPGVISRRLAPAVGSVHGIDLTPAMVELARAGAAAAGVANASFGRGDATATGLPGGTFDGAVTRFSLHHIPVPLRVVEELARVVAPGGAVVIADHLGDEDAGALAWSQEIERLRDPSHWASLPAARLRGLGATAGLELEAEEVVPLVLDLEDWLARGSGGAANRAVLERAFGACPAGAERFVVAECDGRRVLRLQVWMGRWRRPAQAS